MGNKLPTTSGVLSVTGTQQGMNKLVNYLCGVFDVQFNDGNFPKQIDGSNSEQAVAVNEIMLHCFGLVDTYTDVNGIVQPVSYNNTGGTLTDPIVLLPTDRWTGYMFADYSEPIVYNSFTGSSQVVWGSLTARINLIFFFNMKLQRYYVKYGTDYRIQKEALRDKIVGILSHNSPKKGNKFVIRNIYDRTLSEVFRGYTVDDIALQANLQPYYSVRVECDVVYNEKC